MDWKDRGFRLMARAAFAAGWYAEAVADSELIEDARWARAVVRENYRTGVAARKARADEAQIEALRHGTA